MEIAALQKQQNDGDFEYEDYLFSLVRDGASAQTKKMAIRNKDDLQFLFTYDEVRIADVARYYHKHYSSIIHLANKITAGRYQSYKRIKEAGKDYTISARIIFSEAGEYYNFLSYQIATATPERMTARKVAAILRYRHHFTLIRLMRKAGFPKCNDASLHEYLASIRKKT